MNLKNALTILLVDDNYLDRKAFRQDLSLTPKHQYNIIEAASGTEGLTLCHRSRFDLILLDYQLSDMNGLKFLQILGKLTQKIFPPVIVLLEAENASMAIEAIEAGARGYLDKGQAITEEIHLMLLMAILFSSSQRGGNYFLQLA